MTIETSAPDVGANVTPPPVVPPQPTADTPSEIKMPSDAFKKRIDEAKASGERDALKKLGFESIAEAERTKKALKEYQDSQKTEAEKAAARIAELEPAAKRVAELEARMAATVAKRVESLPENLKKIVGERCSTPDQIASLLEVFEEAGMLAAPAPAAPAAKPITPPASTTPTTPAPAGVTAAPNSKLAQWEALKKSNPYVAANYRLTHHAEISAEQKARGQG